jgi:catechol 2,3-dioxygenase-like lactoylglutathione lyase family enzyme
MQTPTSGRVQLALNVSNLDESIAFYSKLFDASPAKVKPGYANFAIETPPLKLVLIENGDAGGINHLGVEVPDTDGVTAAIDRLEARELATDVEKDVSCCYAVQDKVWATAPDGEKWEYYTVLEDAETFSPSTNSAGCCA